MRVNCPHCHARLNAEEHLVSTGQSAPCPACNGLVSFAVFPSAPQIPLSPPPIQHRPLNQATLTRTAPAIEATTIQQRLPARLDARYTIAVALIVVSTPMGLIYALRTNKARDPVPARPSVSTVSSVTPISVNGPERILEEHNRKLQLDVEQLRIQNERIRNESQKMQSQLKDLELENRQLQEKVVTVERWRKAAFLLCTPRLAVGIDATDNGQFRMVASAQYPQTEYVCRISEKLAIPRLVDNDRLAQQLFEEVKEEQSVPQHLVEQLSKYWRVHKYVLPGKDEHPAFVMFRDSATNQSRVGFLLGVNEESLTFQPVGPGPEVIPRGRMQSGTVRKGSAQRLLAEPEADFLDLSILQLAQRLESAENVPGLMSLAIEVHTDELEEAIQLSKEKDNTANDRFFDYLARIRREPFRLDARKEPTRDLRRFAEFLRDEIGTRLARLGVPVMEREELQSVMSERELGKNDSFAGRNHAKLQCATHVVVAEVDKPRQDGSFRVSIRLIETDTGARLFEENGELERKGITTAERFCLNSGQLALLTEKGGASAPLPNNEMAPLFAYDLSHKSLAMKRLVILEDDVGTGRCYRELFSHELQPIPTEGIVVQPVSNSALNKVPRSQHLRLVTSRIASAVLPAAGRIVVVDDDRVTLSIGTEQEVRKGDRFKVARFDKRSDSPDEAHRYSMSVLPFSLRADIASSKHAVAYIDQSGLEQLWPEADARPGDLVLRDGAKDAIVHVARPIPDRTLLTKEAAIRINMLKQAQRMRLNDAMLHFAEGLQKAMSAALEKLGVTCVDSPDSATHVVCAGFTPSKGDPNDTTFHVHLSVRRPGSQQIVATILPIELNTEEVEKWRP